MNIAVDATPLRRKVDGVGRYASNIINTLAAENPDWSINVIGFIDDKHKPNLLNDLPNIRYTYLPIPRRIYSGLYSYIMRLPIDWMVPKFDAYLCLNFKLFPYIKNTRSFVAIHDLAYIDIPNSVESKNRRQLSRLVPWSIQHATYVIAASHFTAARLKDTYDRIHTTYIVSNAIDPEMINSTLNSVKDGSILSVGTIEPRKNRTTLFRAYNMLSAEMQKDHPLIIIGKEGWGRDDILRNDLSKTTLRNIKFTGWVSDNELIKYYSKASLFIQPSLYEGFGLPVLEALLSKTPVIASDIPALREAGKTHVEYFSPQSYIDLHKKILKCINSTPSHKKISSAKSYAENFTWHKSVATLKKLIEQS